MLLDFTTSDLRINPFLYPKAIVALVSDGVLSQGCVQKQAFKGAFGHIPGWEDMYPELQTNQRGLVFRGFNIYPHGLSSASVTTKYQAISYQAPLFGKGDYYKRVVSFIFDRSSVGSRLFIEVVENAPSKDRANHKLEVVSDFDASAVAPYITWETLKK